MASEPTTLNIPQLLAVLIITFILIRYFFFSSPSNTSSSSFPGSQQSRHGRQQQGRAADPRQVDQIAAMFPQVGRREIQWDLQRNGGSVAATTERILGSGRLETPPPSFQPQSPPYTSPLPSFTASKPQHGPDLITRYNLSSKLSQPLSETSGVSGAGAGEGKKPQQGWSQNKNERQALLQRRREEMILNARRKMEEKERGGKGS